MSLKFLSATWSDLLRWRPPCVDYFRYTRWMVKHDFVCFSCPFKHSDNHLSILRLHRINQSLVKISSTQSAWADGMRKGLCHYKRMPAFHIAATAVKIGKFPVFSISFANRCRFATLSAFNPLLITFVLL